MVHDETQVITLTVHPVADSSALVITVTVEDGGLDNAHLYRFDNGSILRTVVVKAEAVDMMSQHLMQSVT